MKDWHKDTNINKALTERFLSLLPQEHRDLYTNTLIQKPNNRFGDTFNYFYMEYRICNKMDLEHSQGKMKQAWIPVDGFKVLCKYFDEGINIISLQLS